MSKLVGTWRLVATKSHDEKGAPLTPSYGPTPMGVVTFQADGRMASVLCDGRKALPSGENEREYQSYAGNYTFDGATLVTKVDCASDPARMGTEQVRKVRFEGNRVTLTPPPRAWRGNTEYRELTWERIA